MLRKLRPDDISQIMHLKEIAGWNQTVNDLKLILSMPGQHRCFSMDDKVVATSCALDYGSFVWIAMVLVHPAHRRQGLATHLLQQIMTENQRRQIWLDATSQGAELYKKLGFIPVTTITRMRVCPTPDPSLLSSPGLSEIQKNDASIFGGDRSLLLQHWNQNAITINKDNYIYHRPGSICRQIGPLVAHDQETAWQLLCALYTQTKTQSYIDIPERKSWKQTLENIGGITERTFVRMTTTGKETNTSLSPHIWATSGPEFG